MHIQLCMYIVHKNDGIKLLDQRKLCETKLALEISVGLGNSVRFGHRMRVRQEPRSPYPNPTPSPLTCFYLHLKELYGWSMATCILKYHRLSNYSFFVMVVKSIDCKQLVFWKVFIFKIDLCITGGIGAQEEEIRERGLARQKAKLPCWCFLKDASIFCKTIRLCIYPFFFLLSFYKDPQSVHNERNALYVTCNLSLFMNVYKDAPCKARL